VHFSAQCVRADYISVSTGINWSLELPPHNFGVTENWSVNRHCQQPPRPMPTLGPPNI